MVATRGLDPRTRKGVRVQIPSCAQIYWLKPNWFRCRIDVEVQRVPKRALNGFDGDQRFSPACKPSLVGL